MIVTITVPGLAVLPAFSVSVLVLVVLLGLNEQSLHSANRMLTVLKPFSRFTAIVLVTLCPRVTFKLLGEADRLKSGADAEALTVKLNGSGMRQAS